MMSRTSSPTAIVRGACPHDCPDTCAWHVTVEDGVAVELVGDPEHPITRGGLCAKVNHYLERVYGRDRLLYPMRRVGPKGAGQFERVSWDEILDDISARLKSIIREDGPTAILPYSYMGTQGLIQAFGMDRRFFARLGATRLERKICGSADGDAVRVHNDRGAVELRVRVGEHMRPGVVAMPSGWWASLSPAERRRTP